MTFSLQAHGREIARGTLSDVLDAGEERRLVEVLTLGRETCEPVPGWRIVAAGVRVVPVPSGCEPARRAA